MILEKVQKSPVYSALDTKKTMTRASRSLTHFLIIPFRLAGLNSHQRQVKCVTAHVRKVKDDIFLGVCNEIEELLYKHTRENAKAIQHLWSGDNSGGGAGEDGGSSKPVPCHSQQLRTLLKRLVESVCAPTRGASKKTRNVTASIEADEQLKKNIREAVAQWRKEWDVVDKRLPPRPKLKTFDDEDDDEKDEKTKAARKGGQKRKAKTAKKTEESGNTGDEAAQETNQDTACDECDPRRMDVDGEAEAECAQRGDVADNLAKSEEEDIERHAGKDTHDSSDEMDDSANETRQGDGEAQEAQGNEDHN